MRKQPLQSSDFYISPEMCLLLLCCINKPSAQDYEKIQELVRGTLDWALFYKLVVRHRVYSIVYKNLKNVHCVEINRAVMSDLEKIDKQSRMKILLLYVTELTRLMKCFGEQDIRAISIKGPVLSLLLYNDISQRMSKDLDILVCQTDVAKAEQILVSKGYTREGEVSDLTDKQRAVLLKIAHHFSYINRKTGMNVEIHWKFNYESYNFNFEEMWAEKSEVTLAGVRIYILNQEENFLYLVFHGAKHMWARVKWLCDIAELIKNDSLDWDYISRRAKKLGIEHLFSQTLILSSLLFGTDPHYELLKKRTGHPVFRMVQLAMDIILSTDYDPSHPDTRFYWTQKMYMFLWNAGLAKKLSFIKFHFYPTENDFAQIKLTDRYFSMYFLVRLSLVLKRKWKKFCDRG